MNSCFAGNVTVREVLNQAHERARIDLVDLGPPDLDQMHVINSKPSISLVKSNS